MLPSSAMSAVYMEQLADPRDQSLGYPDEARYISMASSLSMFCVAVL